MDNCEMFSQKKAEFLSSIMSTIDSSNRNSMPPPSSHCEEGGHRKSRGQNHPSIFYSRLHSFAVDVSIIGARAIVDVRRTWYEKIMWSVLILFGLGLAVYQIQDRLAYYFQHPTSASVDVQHNDQLKFPQVTVCNENVIFRSAAEKQGIAEVLQQMYPLVYLPGMPAPNLTVFDKYYWNDTTNEAFYESLAQPFSAAGLYCTYNGIPCNLTGAMPQVKPLLTNMGVCFTFNYEGLNIMATNPGTSYGLVLFLNVQQYDYLVPWGTYTAGFRVLIHDQGEVPWVRQLGFDASAGFVTSAAVTYSQTKQAQPPYGKCHDEDGYTESGCRMDCLTKYVVDKCACRANFMPGRAPICNIVQGYYCVNGALNNYTIDPNGSLACQCPPQCVTDVFDYSLSAAVFSDFTLKFFNAQGFYSSTKELNDNVVGLQVFFSTLSSVTIRTEAAYSFMALLSDVGGALGLLLGATALTLVEIAEFGVHLLQDVFSRRRQRRQNKQRRTNGKQTDSAKEKIPSGNSPDNNNFKHRVISVIPLDENDARP